MPGRASPPAGTRSIQAFHLGLADYESTWRLQKDLQSRLVLAKRADTRPRPPHALLTVEHPPVYTLGKSGDAAHLIASDEELAAAGATLVHIDRGGDITFHGPGQLVAYPVLDLDRFYTDIHRYLRDLEEVVIRTCADVNLATCRIDGLTGVWVKPNTDSPERKICAMGIRCSRWVTSHGLALNVNTDLAHFDRIVPCGIADRGVTSIERELGHPVDVARVRELLLVHFARVFEADVSDLGTAGSDAILSAYPPPAEVHS